jgi:hypothetical protein
MKDTIISQVIEQLQELPDNLQRQVLDFIQRLKATADKEMKGVQLIQFAVAISQEDLEIMQQAIDKDCEKIDVNEW